MSLPPLMSSPDAGTALPPQKLSDSSTGQVARSSAGEPADRSLDVVAAAPLVGLPSGGLERSEHKELSLQDPLEVPFDLTDETNRDLRRWSSALFKVLDVDFPPYGALDDYERVVTELERRQTKDGQDSPSTTREKFRDNAFNRRFELFRNGMLAGYVSYTMRAGALRLHRTVISEVFDGIGLEGVLMRNVILMAHKRRLAAIPYCPVAQGFLQENPQYRQLMHAS